MTPEEQAAAAAKAEADASSKGLLAAKVAETQKRQAAEARVAELEAEKSKAAEDAAAKRGEFEDLYKTAADSLKSITAERDTLLGERTARLDALKASNEEAKKALPEELQALVPEGLSPDATAKQIARLAKLGGEGLPTGGKTKAGKDKPKAVPAECATQAKAHGKDPNWWYDNVWVLTHPPKS
jgi:hypothetical protein